MTNINFPRNLTNFIAAILLAFIFFITLFSIKNDSLTMDELAHLPAGYSYLTQRDMRLNPEHPPLVKDLAALPLLFIEGIKFPSEIKDWQTELNGQWGFGNIFLFKRGNPVDLMIFWGRIPMILLLVFFGFFLFKFAREHFGDKAALLSLFFYSFSPTFLAHGRLVTTDVGAAFGAVLATYFFLKFLYIPNLKNIIFAGIAFGIAQLLKFPLILLFPFFGILFLFWIIVRVEKEKIPQFFFYGIKIAVIFAVAAFLIWFVYFYHTINLPSEIIKTYGQEFLGHHPLNKISPRLAEKIISFTAENPILKPWSYYLLGVFMATERAIGGHTTFFFGEVSAAGWAQYFPLVYILKEPLAFHIFTIIAILFFAYSLKKPFWQNTLSRFKNWTKIHFVEFSFLLWIALYWLVSLSSNLNIGVRHLLPTFPFAYMLVSKEIVLFLESGKKLQLKFIQYSLFIILILWQTISVILIYPHFLSYFNEIAGGPNNGYLYTVNSNLDWGQDLKRLKKWIEENKIEKIYVDYFGGADTRYYLGDKLIPWQGTRGDPKEIPKGSYLAVSATFLQGGRGKPFPGFNQPSGYYFWLYQYEPPIAKIGYSIFVYKIE